jgi:hypothetical protein
VAEFTLIHEDDCVPNILVDHGVPRYVDWEWAVIGYPARRRSYLAGCRHTATRRHTDVRARHLR